MRFISNNTKETRKKIRPRFGRFTDLIKRVNIVYFVLHCAVSCCVVLGCVGVW